MEMQQKKKKKKRHWKEPFINICWTKVKFELIVQLPTKLKIKLITRWNRFGPNLSKTYITTHSRPQHQTQEFQSWVIKVALNLHLQCLILSGHSFSRIGFVKNPPSQLLHAQSPHSLYFRYHQYVYFNQFSASHKI